MQLDVLLNLFVESGLHFIKFFAHVSHNVQLLCWDVDVAFDEQASETCHERLSDFGAETLLDGKFVLRHPFLTCVVQEVLNTTSKLFLDRLDLFGEFNFGRFLDSSDLLLNLCVYSSFKNGLCFLLEFFGKISASKHSGDVFFYNYLTLYFDIIEDLSREGTRHSTGSAARLGL